MFAGGTAEFSCVCAGETAEFSCVYAGGTADLGCARVGRLIWAVRVRVWEGLLNWVVFV